MAGLRDDPDLILEERTPMIEALKSEQIVEKCGGRFKLCALIQRRLVQLMEGARPMVERDGRSDLEVVIDEILNDRITLEVDMTNLTAETSLVKH